MDIKTLANKIFLDFSEEEWETINNEFELLEQEIKSLNEINTEDVEAMDLPFTLNENALRMDTEGEVLSVEELLENAPDQSEDMVRIVKVVG